MATRADMGGLETRKLAKLMELVSFTTFSVDEVCAGNINSSCEGSLSVCRMNPGERVADPWVCNTGKYRTKTMNMPSESQTLQAL